jgi:hypothetical protein
MRRATSNTNRQDRFVRFAIGFAVCIPDSGVIAKFFFDPKPVKSLDSASAEIPHASIAPMLQSA